MEKSLKLPEKDLDMHKGLVERLVDEVRSNFDPDHKVASYSIPVIH